MSDLTGYELSSVVELDAKITDLGDSPTAADIYEASLPYSERASAAVAAKRAGSGGGGSQLVWMKTTLTNAQVLALPSTGVDVVPAAGANTLILLVNAFLRLVWTADYTNIDSGGASLSIELGTAGSIADLIGANDVSGLLAFGENGNAFMWPGSNVTGTADLVTGVVSAEVDGKGGVGDEGQLVNQPLTLTANNAGSGNYTGGDVANSLEVYVGYSVLTLD